MVDYFNKGNVYIVKNCRLLLAVFRWYKGKKFVALALVLFIDAASDRADQNRGKTP